MKFFDLRLSFISKEERNFLDIKKHGNVLYQEKNYILAPCLKAIKEGDQVQVFKTLKANGENVQISYNQLIKSWVISSKNVALIARNEKDLEIYKKIENTDRFHFAILMAESWFAKINSMT